MNTIQKLPIALCNQIAAGEVVERPANVVKELVENSLDAGADSIHVELEHGGLQRITIRDNGIGIAQQYLETALERYTTSKIASFEDMYALHTFGFRGEALASIASVSVLTLASAYKNEHGIREESAYIVSHYGVVKERGISAPVNGTCITIENLFLNTPARLKFLKTPTVEQKKCSEVILRLALVHLDAELTFSVGGRKLFHFTKGQTLLERAQNIFPNELTEHLVEFNTHYKRIVVRGLCSTPMITQKKNDKLLLFVNNRSVTDKFLMRAIREGYKEYLTSKEYPFGVFFIDIAPDEIDVNVHPTKSEVRFIDEGMCIKAIIIALKNALQHHSELPHQVHSAVAQATRLPQIGDKMIQDVEPEISKPIVHVDREHYWETPKAHIIDRPLVLDDSPVTYGMYSHTNDQQAYAQQSESIVHTLSHVYDSMHSSTHSASLPLEEHSPHIEKDSSTTSLHSHDEICSIVNEYVFICTIAETYLVYHYRGNDELLIIDQHAAHERILEEYITRNVSCNIQYLSPPAVFSLHQQEEERFEELESELIKLGFDIVHTQGMLTIKAIPSYITKAQLYTYIKEMLLDITDEVVARIHKKACTNAIKKGDILTSEDAYALLAQWLIIPNNTHCPHGRPISIRIHKGMIEHLFKRVT